MTIVDNLGLKIRTGPADERTRYVGNLELGSMNNYAESQKPVVLH